MKTQLLFFISFILYANLLFGQIQDNQWLIWNSLGKQSVNTTNDNVYPSGNSINNVFTLVGIESPDTHNVLGSRNDIFIIYSNGEHLNSREQPGLGFFYNPNDLTSVGIENHLFKGAPAKVEYLYLTNRYEDDDPPPRVYAMSGSIGAIPLANTYALGTTSPGVISANHDVVIDKDITLIIDFDQLKNLAANIPPDNKEDSSFVLRFDGIQDSATMNIVSDDILDLEPVFNTSSVYTDMGYSESGEQVTLNTSNRYIYVNLRPRSTIIAYGPDLQDPLGTPTHNAVFTVVKNGQPIAQHAEPISLSHDPNFLRVESICKTNDGGHIVTYHLQFENTASQPAKKYEAQVDFPAHFDLSCIRPIKWSAGGKSCSGDIDAAGNRFKFIFNSNVALLKCTAVNDTQGIGFVKFRVKVKPGHNVEDLNFNLRLLNPLVKFDTIYPIEDFRDLIICESNAKPGQPNYFTSKPPLKSKRNLHSNDQNKEKPDTLTPGETPKNYGNTKDEGMAKQMVLPVDVGEIHCYRPITEGPCICKPWWKSPYAIAGGILILAAGMFVVLKKKKVKVKP